MQVSSVAILTVSLASLVYFLAQYAKRKAVVALAIIIAIAFSLLTIRLWNEREFIPYPHSYLTRLTWLEGSKSSLDGMDCAKFIANAHGDELTFTYWKTNTDVVNVYQRRTDLRETALQAGDVANFNGQHVAVYLGAGSWIDADYRRGNVARFKLVDKPESDPWFQGPVTIKRFKGR
jgi:hypothetical protein